MKRSHLLPWLILLVTSFSFHFTITTSWKLSKGQVHLLLFYVLQLDIMGSDLPYSVLPDAHVHKQSANGTDSSTVQKFLPTAPAPFGMHSWRTEKERKYSNWGYLPNVI